MKRTTGHRIVGTLLVTLAALPPPTSAQEPLRRAELPERAAVDLIDFLNDSSTLRVNGRFRLPSDRVIIGDVGALGGPFVLAGEIRGNLVVVNGDLRIREGARVEGFVTVVGGDAVDTERGTIEGALLVYEQPLRYRERDGRLSLRDRRRPRGEGEEDEDRGLLSHTRFLVRTGGSYNRVEGLPVLFGPVLETDAPHAFGLDLLGVWRSESGLALDEDELGWLLRAGQDLGPGDLVSLGASFRSTVEPIAGWGLGSTESSLSTFFLHKDFRDYYERRGWSFSTTVRPPGLPLSFTLEFLEEDHTFAPVSSPWTLRKNDDPWRPQPLIAEGDLQALVLEGVLDTRNDRDEPSDGWLVTARAVRGVGGELQVPEHQKVESLPQTTVGPPPSAVTTVPPSPVDTDFTMSFVDARRYNRLGPDSELALRAVWSGSLDGDPLPSQFQQALGGEGTLPGYRLFSVDCGARAEALQIRRVAFDDDEDAVDPVFERYGCDRALLFQAEYRAHLDFDIDFGPDDEEEWDERWDWYPAVDLSPSWVAFFDIGRGWSESDAGLDTDTFADIGAGLLLGNLGFYWAFPLEGSDRDVNFFIRLQRRF